MILDKYQKKIIKEKNNLLILASAGSGKTFTLIHKVKHLLKTYSSEEILIVSFTNETVNNLKGKLNEDIHIFTFHKLAIYLLNKYNYNYKLVGDNILIYSINEYFINYINDIEKKLLCKHFFELNYKSLIKSNKFKYYKKNIHTFIKLYKTNNYSYDYILTLLKSKKDSLFILIVINIMTLYNNELRSTNSLDLDDLITEASKVVKNLNLKYKYIFVDEFQDTSQIRFDLIYNIFINTNSIINIFGDDFQSIYAFSGCKLSIMLNINKYIPNIKTLTLNKNYRLSNDLITISNSFITKNDKQIKKDIYSEIYNNNTINIIYYSNKEKALNKALKEGLRVSKDIMILSRYKHDLKGINNYKTLTVHEAKGLEADIVIILNMNNGYYGFPSNIKNHIFIDKIEKESESFLYAEERRLFFVAMTRARKKLYILVPRDNPSPFIKEIKKML